MKFPSLLLFQLLAFSVLGGQGEFAVSRIAPDLLKNANVVIRYEHTIVEVRSLTRHYETRKFAITILNEAGDKFATVAEYYDKFRSVEKFEGTLYDAFGQKIRSLKKSEISDLSATSDISLAEDNRVKVHSFYYKSYPYTIEYHVELSSSQTMYLTQWIAAPAGAFAVESTVLDVIVPANYDLRYQANNFPNPPEINSVDNKKKYTWKVSNFPAIRREFASPPLSQIVPFVMLAPTEFQVENYTGNMQSWKDFGKFILTLNEGRDELPDKMKIKVREIVAGLKTDREKINALYEFMQKNTRYVSIQLGIGSWRPFDANYVSTKGYGDCKALSNYMQSMLKEAGIKSYYTLVTAGSDKPDINVNFASPYFNHAILCVPNKGDTVWLECTSQTNMPGYMGSFTGNRHSLLITEEGGVIVKTPRYGIEENKSSRKIISKLDEEGTLELNSVTMLQGEKQDYIHMIVNSYPKDKIRQYYLEENIGIGTFEIRNFDYKEVRGSLPEMHETLSLKAINYATISGKRLFIVPNVLGKSLGKLSTTEERKYDIHLNSAFTEQDEVEIELPAGYVPENIPQPVKLETKFGIYSSSTKIENNKLIYSRTLIHHKGNYPKTDYPELVKFYDAVYKADRSRVVLVKN